MLSSLSKLVFILLFLFNLKLQAQTFIPDENGYISNPKFKEMLKAKKYLLVGRYDTLQRMPLLIAAQAVYDSKPGFIDLHGKFTPKNEMKEAYSYGGAMGSIGMGMPEPREIEYRRNDPYQQLNINGKLGTFNKTSNKQGLTPIYNNLQHIENQLLITEKDDKFGIAKSDGTIIKPPQYESLSAFDSYNNKKKYRLLLIKQNKKLGLIDHDGQMVLQPVYDALAFHPGADNGNLILLTIGEKKGLANIKGKILQVPAYEQISPIAHGLFLITKQEEQEKKYGLMDTMGRTVVTPIYSERLQFLYEQKLIKFNEGTKSKPKIGLMNLQGKVLINADYQEFLHFTKQMVVIKKGDKLGATGLDGKEIIPIDYEHLFTPSASPFIVIEKEKKYGLTDLKGKILIPIKHDVIMPVKNGTAIISDSDKWSRINLKTMEITPMSYDEIELHTDFLVVTQGSKMGVLDLEGKVLFPIKHDRIKNASQAIRQGFITIEKNHEIYTVDRYGNEMRRNTIGY